MNNLLRRYSGPLLIAVMAIATLRCAHPVIPEGGPKDVQPPMVLGADPPIYSTSFNSRKVEIRFDEFIQLKDPQKEIFISPPMETPPEFKAKGKSLIIEFPGDLRENTTYSIFFGNSITDITERNPKANFEYVFSTGNSIDSLSITGRVVSAFDLEPAPGILVMIYQDNNDTVPFDSMPLLVRPASASRTVGDGYYRLGNLQGGEYKIFGLEDKNSNFIYDLPNERIAFLDSLVSPHFVPRRPPDSLMSDSVVMAQYQEMLDASSKDITLKLFTEADSVQKLTEATALSDFSLRFVFKIPPRDVELEVLEDENLGSDWCIRENSIDGDTIICWLREAGPDTMRVVVTDAGEILDTVRLIIRKPDYGRKKKDDTEEEKVLKVATNVKGRKLEINRDLVFTFSRPLVRWDSTEALLIEGTDTLTTGLTMTDPVMRRAIIQRDWKENTEYEVMIPDSTFIGLGGITNDTVKIIYSTRNLSDYGHLFMELINKEPGVSYIVQLLSADEKILRESISSGGEVLEFRYLLPGKYLLKAIRDINGDQKWNPGDYIQDILPEEVIYFPINLDIRANWEVRESWELP